MFANKPKDIKRKNIKFQCIGAHYEMLFSFSSSRHTKHTQQLILISVMFSLSSSSFSFPIKLYLCAEKPLRYLSCTIGKHT